MTCDECKSTNNHRMWIIDNKLICKKCDYSDEESSAHSWDYYVECISNDYYLQDSETIVIKNAIFILEEQP